MMVYRLRRPSPRLALQPNLSFAANCGQNPASSLACCNRLTAFSNADAKSDWTAGGSTNPLILKEIFPDGIIFEKLTGCFFCVLLPTHQNFSQLRSGSVFPDGRGLFPHFKNCVDNLKATGLNYFFSRDRSQMNRQCAL